MNRNSLFWIVITSLIMTAACSEKTVKAPTVPRVVLDHAFVVVDDLTYDAIAASEFLKTTFAASKVSAVQSGTGSSWTGAYFFGPETYIEILRVSSVSDDQPGTGGLGFVVERRGELDQLEAVLRASVSAPINRQLMSLADEGGKSEPNFYMLTLQYEGLGNVGFMEYHERIAEKYGGITRTAVHSKTHDSSKALGNIAVIKAALNEATTNAYKEVFAALNYAVSSNGQIIELRGPEQIIQISPATESSWGIQEIGFKLINPPSRDIEEQIGTSRLVLRADGNGVWVFGK